jgi:hypothetical protein
MDDRLPGADNHELIVANVEFQQPVASPSTHDAG